MWKFENKLIKKFILSQHESFSKHSIYGLIPQHFKLSVKEKKEYKKKVSKIINRLTNKEIRKINTHNYCVINDNIDIDSNFIKDPVYNGVKIDKLYPKIWSFKPDFSDVDDNCSELDIGNAVHNCSKCNAEMFIDERRGSGVANPKFYLCCGNGRIKLPVQRHPPSSIFALFLPNHEHHKVFMKHIRAINSALAMACVSVNFERLKGAGVPYFRIYGEVLRYIGSYWTSNANHNPKFAQIWHYDPNEQSRIRLDRIKNYSKLNQKESTNLEYILQQLQQTLLSINPYIKHYVQSKEKMAQSKELNLVFHDIAPISEHRKKYSLPSELEFASVMEVLPPDPDIKPKKGNIVSDIVMENRTDGKLEHIDFRNPLCDPLCYPILFPYGLYL